MWHLFGDLTRNFRLIRLRKFRGQRPAGPAGHGSMSLNGHLFRPVGISSSCFSFTRFFVDYCLLKKTSIWPLLNVRKLPGHHIVLNIVDSRHAVMRWKLFPPELFLIRIICLLLRPIPRPRRSLGHYSFVKNTAKGLFLCFLGVRFFFFFFWGGGLSLGVFLSNFKICTPWHKVQNWASQ